MPFTKEEPITLNNLGDGAATEMFNDELQKVLDNIIDPNTKAKSTREVILRVRLTPDDDRSIADIEMVASSKLAPTRSFLAKAVLGRTGNKGHARELAKQRSLFNQDDKKKVVGIDRDTGEVLE